MSKKSEVWKYFKKINNEKAECQYKIDESTICSSIIQCKGSSTSGLKRHLQSIHKIQVTSNEEQIELQTKINFSKRNKKTLGEILSRIASVDGMSIHAMLNSNCVKCEVHHHLYQMPKSASTIMLHITEFYEECVNEFKEIFKTLIDSGNRFSIATDEWSHPLSLRRYMNISVISNEKIYRLGLTVSLVLLLLFCFFLFN